MEIVKIEGGRRRKKKVPTRRINIGAYTTADDRDLSGLDAFAPECVSL